MDHYQTLGVSQTATDVEIRAAYRRLAMKWHPDRHQGDADKLIAESTFKTIQEAYRILSDASSRQHYDQSISGLSNIFGFYAGMASGFEDLARNYARRDNVFRESVYPPGADVKWKAVVPLKTAVDGGEVVYTRKERVECEECDGEGWFDELCEVCSGAGIVGTRSGQRYCSQCAGEGMIGVACGACEGKKKVSKSFSTRIRIPPGVVDGDEIVAPALGRPSRYYAGRPGDLQVRISLKSEAGFKFSGLDIHGVLKVPFSIALLGGRVQVTLPLSRLIEVDVPARTNSGKKIRLSGGGLSNRTGNTGDVLLSVSIILPKSRRQLSAIEQSVIRALDS